MHICEIINGEIQPTQEALLIKPIRKLYNQDRSKSKQKFFDQLSVIYFMVDPRSSYNYILDENQRLETILTECGIENFKMTKDLKEAMEVYKKHCVTTAGLLLESTKIAIDKVRDFLKNVNLSAVDDKGKPLYTISSITTAIKQIPQLAKDVQDAERAVAKEIEEKGNVRGGDDSLSLMDKTGILL